jgi:formate dehydrogenase alpha subunit
MGRKNGDRENDELVPVSWESALDLIAQRLIEIKKMYGPQSIAFLGSSKCTNEENYLFQKIARALIGTNNIDNGGYISGQSLLKVFDEKMDDGYRKNRLADLEKAEVILTLGADPSHSVPVVGYYLKRAARQGIPLIVVDPRKTELASIASIWLSIKPQTDLELINGLVALLHEKKAYDSSFVDQYTEGFSLFRYSLSSLDIEKISRLTHLEMAALNKTVELLQGKKIAIVIGHGVIQQKYGSHTLGAILNLSLITGSLGCAGAGVYVLARENNQLGAMDMGTVPDLLPGRQSIGNNAARKKWEKNWKINISPDPGLNLVQMIEAAEKGNLKALYIMGENPLRALPEPDRVKNALKNLEFIVVQDILNNETVKIADVVLPAAAISEKEGSVTNLEGRIQSFKAVTPPPAKAKPDWEILDLLSVGLGGANPYGSLEKIRQEIRQFVPMYGSLNGADHTWIQTTSAKALFKDRDAEGLITFYPVVSTEDDPADSDYPFTAIVGSQRYHLGSGTRTQASDRIQGFEFTGKLEISPQDGANLDLEDDDTIIVRSRFGVLKRKVRVKKALPPGHIFVPAGFNDNEAMRLLSLSDMTKPDSAGWKTCQVKLEKAPLE